MNRELIVMEKHWDGMLDTFSVGSVTEHFLSDAGAMYPGRREQP